MIRASKLEFAEHCGLSATIETNSTTVYAMRGDAFHAANAAHYRPDEQRFIDARAVAFGVLPVDDGADVTHMLQRLWASWTPPEHAKFEVPIAVNRDGLAVPYGSPEAISQGTADCSWVDGEWLVVVDFKSGARAEWNVPAPGVNLQLLDYVFGLADLLGKTKVKLGIYRGAEGVEDPWLWAEIDLDTPEATKLWERVRGAALRDPKKAVLGTHCAECWVRLQCPAHLVPAILEVDREEEWKRLGLPDELAGKMAIGPESALAPIASPVDRPIEPARLVRLLNAIAALKDLEEVARDFAKAYVAVHGGVEVDGKVWGPIDQKGKELVSIKALKAAGIYERAVAVGAVTQGAPTKQHRWTLVKKADKAA